MKHLKIIALLLRNSLMSHLEYRFSFIMWSITSILWIMLTLISIEFIFGHVNSIAGWTKNQMLLIATVFGIFSSIMWMFFLPSAINITKLVRKGTLDFYLLKPIGNRFLLSTNQFSLDNFPRACILVLIMFGLIDSMGLKISFLSWIQFILFLLIGLGIFYNIFFTAAVTSIWFIDIFNLEDLYANILNVGRLPTHIFEGFTKLSFMFILPVMFVATFPAQILLGTADITMAITGLVILIISSLGSQWFWRFALKHYSSASS